MVADHFARVKDIAKARSVKAGSVSPALKRLSTLGLVKYVQREYVALTPVGERAARRILSRHRILTRFFAEILRMEPRAAEEQACAMEHSLSSEGMDRLVRFFEYLVVCPLQPESFLSTYGNCPLVTNGAERTEKSEPECVEQCTTQQTAALRQPSLASLRPGEQGRVTHVNAKGAIRQRLLDMGVLPDTLIEVERVAPSGDPVWIKLGGAQIALRRQEADAVSIVSGV